MDFGIFWIFWIFSGRFLHATNISSILSISVLENPSEISVLSMKIVKLNESWAFLGNLWEGNPEVIHLYGIGLKDKDSFFPGRGQATLFHSNSTLAECYFILSSKSVRPFPPPLPSFQLISSHPLHDPSHRMSHKLSWSPLAAGLCPLG